MLQRNRSPTQRRHNWILCESDASVVLNHGELPRQAHLSAPRRSGQLICVIPIVHPSNEDRPISAWNSIEADGAIVVLSKVCPTVCSLFVGGTETRAVKVSKKILFS